MTVDDVDPGFPGWAEVTAGFGAIVEMGVQLGRLSTALEAQHALEQKFQHAIMSIPIKPHAVTVNSGNATILNHEHDLGPPDGYAWAVQRLTIGGLTGSDLVSLYKGPGIAAAVDPTNLIQVMTATTPTWGPGRTGLVLFPGDAITASGTGLSASTVYLTGEVIQLEQWIVPQFLL